MGEPFDILDIFRLVAEFIAALVGIIFFFKLKHSYWKWFSVYLVLIFLQEFFWYERDTFSVITTSQYYAYFGIPIQFVFLYWLYALKSLKKPKLFVICMVVYIIPLLFKIYFEETDLVYSFNINIGTAILIILMILEFIKQIRNDNILVFMKNKMFYINLGVIIFYAGTYPFLVFQTELYEEHIDLWKVYYIYFLIANCLLYLLFTASFIWGKQKS